jgi:hypothetical protein
MKRRGVLAALFAAYLGSGQSQNLNDTPIMVTTFGGLTVWIAKEVFHVKWKTREAKIPLDKVMDILEAKP